MSTQASKEEDAAEIKKAMATGAKADPSNVSAGASCYSNRTDLYYTNGWCSSTYRMLLPSVDTYDRCEQGVLLVALFMDQHCSPSLPVCCIWSQL